MLLTHTQKLAPSSASHPTLAPRDLAPTVADGNWRDRCAAAAAALLLLLRRSCPHLPFLSPSPCPSPSLPTCLSGPSVAASLRSALPRRRRRHLQQAPPAAAAAGSSRCGLLLPVRVSSTVHETLDACPHLFPTVKDGGDGHRSGDTAEQSSRAATTQ